MTWWNDICLSITCYPGGHTSEALTLVSALDFSRYTPRIYIISEGDSLSADKAAALESRNTSSNKVSNCTPRYLHMLIYPLHTIGSYEHLKTEYTLLTIPRARRVHQSIITTIPTAMISFLHCLDHVIMQPLLSPGDPRPFADVLILNGPGTCFVLCGAIYLNKVRY
jgi:beta-1,4-N-acetylglucosaminyltransferase